LRTGAGGDGGERGRAEAVITPEQRAQIDEARRDIVETRQKLRAVQLELNRDIARLDTTLKVANIAAVPAVLAALAIALGLVQRARRARARA
jgi:hypothetical protein